MGRDPFFNGAAVDVAAGTLPEEARGRSVQMKFRLQRVLDLRHAQEKIAQQELATRQQDYQAILGRLDQLLEDESTLFELIKRPGRQQYLFTQRSSTSIHILQS